MDTSSNEVFTYHQAQKQADWLQFVNSMEKEIEDHEGRGHWELVLRSTVTPGNKPIKVIWSFKRKRFAGGRLNKHKARICAHGGMQRLGNIDKFLGIEIKRLGQREFEISQPFLID
ncbi:hypothetical protein ACHAXH_001932 [Discostella pseudostelligera]